MKLDCIDTFSGIGGITLGLHDFTNVIQYCEWDSFCQNVLLERMKEGRIDRAPIHSDIKTLYMSQRVHPQMICGGFPCQDISSLGLQKGIADGERSSMFYHVMRVVDECPSIQVIFLENVSNILNCGMQEVVEACVKRGLNMQWKIYTAGEMGAPHVRSRWFCLICKPGTDLSGLCLESKVAHHWENEPASRITFKPHVKEDDSFDPNWIQRCQTLGNAVVPHVVREAFVNLAKSSTKWDQIAECMAEYSSDLSKLQYPYPESGLIHGGRFFAMPKKVPFDFKHNVKITMNNEEQTLGNYPTPRRGLTHASSLTDRSIRDLPTVLVHCDQTKKYLEDQGITLDSKVHTHILPNVNYIEWLMGYEKDWTKSTTYIKGVNANKQSQVQDDAVEDTIDANSSPKKASTEVKKHRLNGMHILMKENPGKDIKYVASIWKGLSDEERKVYSEKARVVSLSM